MLQCWAQKPDDRPTFVALREFLLEVGGCHLSSHRGYLTAKETMYSIHFQVQKQKILDGNLETSGAERSMFPQKYMNT